MVMFLAAVAALSFTIGGVFMKYADGIGNGSAAALFLALFALGAVVQSHAMRGADLGTTYIVVLGLEAALAFGLGAVLFGETVTATKVAAVLLIVAGIALLRARQGRAPMTSRINQAAERWRPRIVGVDCQMLRLDGRPAPYVNFDNAASTPPLAEVVETVERFLPYYSNVHRGTGFKSRVSTALYDEARKTIAGFVGADERTHTVVFGKNTTEAINKLAHRYPFERDSVVITTALEHHSNDLPWRRRAHVLRVRADDEGRLDEEHFDHLLECHRERVALVAVSGASNVTGLVPPIHRLASKAHAAGARILVDAAQLAAHRRIDIRRAGDPEHLDFVAFSAHKMYAPFGVGALVGPRDVFLQGEPEYSGGGTVDVVTADDVYWADPPDREEAGTPNVVGAIAMAAAARELSAAGLDRIEHDEALLTSYALERLRQVPETTIYGSSDPSRVDDRLGVISFNLHSSHHALVAAILGWRQGSACGAAASARSRTWRTCFTSPAPTVLRGAATPVRTGRAARAWCA